MELPIHKVTIKNLGPIKVIKNFEVRRFNVVIGESASGKSLLAKAIYLFNEQSVLRTFTVDIEFTNRIIRENAIALFREYTGYTITYDYGNGYTITVTHNPNMKSNKSISIRRSATLKGKINALGASIKEEQRKALREKLGKWLSASENLTGAERTEQIDKLANDLYNDIQNTRGEIAFRLSAEFFKELSLLPTYFIPASRGYIYEFDERRLDADRRRSTKPKDDEVDYDMTLVDFSWDYRRLLRKFRTLESDLLRGTVRKGAGRRVELSVKGQILDIVETSSGQKQLFPLLMMLDMLSKGKESEAVKYAWVDKHVRFSIGGTYTVIIEEPEANIHPKDQKEIVEAIIKFANKTYSRVFIATHSPYILMAMNNLIEADARKYKPLKDLFVPIKNVNVQEMKDGEAKNIIDKEENLIDLDYIDEVHDKIVTEFDKILNAKR